MTMEKYGVEVAPKKPSGEKRAEADCAHPVHAIRRDGDSVFCNICDKYVKLRGK